MIFTINEITLKFTNMTLSVYYKIGFHHKYIFTTVNAVCVITASPRGLESIAVTLLSHHIKHLSVWKSRLLLSPRFFPVIPCAPLSAPVHSPCQPTIPCPPLYTPLRSTVTPCTPLQFLVSHCISLCMHLTSPARLLTVHNSLFCHFISILFSEFNYLNHMYYFLSYSV